MNSGESSLNNEGSGAYIMSKNDKNGADEEWQQVTNSNNLNETRASTAVSKSQSNENSDD